MPIRLTEPTLAPALRTLLEPADVAPDDGLLTREEVVQHWGDLKNFQQQLASRFNLFAHFDAGKLTAIIRKPVATESILMVAGGAMVAVHLRALEQLLTDITEKDRREVGQTDLARGLASLLEKGTTPEEKRAIHQAAEEVSRTLVRGLDADPSETTLDKIYERIATVAESGMSRAGAQIRIFAAIVEQILAEDLTDYPGDRTAYLEKRVGAARLVWRTMFGSNVHDGGGNLNLENIERRITPEMKAELARTVEALQAKFGNDFFEWLDVPGMLREIETVPDLLEYLMSRATATYGTQVGGPDTRLTEETIRGIAEFRRIATSSGEGKVPLITAMTCIELMLFQRSNDFYPLPEETRAAVAAFGRSMGLKEESSREADPFSRERLILERLFRR